ncbi:uncharacterized protein B0303.7 [Anthonomus grandis grandis]|uniref:uncharacterized protein B0303.7 n=1 Tax=Anthonomus grandis grandis TaxID=2921223 RepID=UPI002165CDA7|nr:uncharacterized protein B0303.7 [Anthonomus grandis grandis]
MPLPKQKKKPPARPPPPNFTKLKSVSSINLNHQNQTVNLTEWSPPNSPKPDRVNTFGGSISSSFSSSTSSLASSKKSFEFDSPTNSLWPLSAQPQSSFYSKSQSNTTSCTGASFQSYLTPVTNNQSRARPENNSNVPSFFGPTIIRPKPKPIINKSNDLSNGSPPMPNHPPPSPPKEASTIETPYGIALYDFPASHSNDLPLQSGDVVILLSRISEDWLYGRVMEKEGMFPENFVDIQVPLKEEEDIVTALYDFPAQVAEDLSLKTGDKVKVIRKISDDWLFGECNGQKGQFPKNFVNRIPNV